MPARLGAPNGESAVAKARRFVRKHLFEAVKRRLVPDRQELVDRAFYVSLGTKPSLAPLRGRPRPHTVGRPSPLFLLALPLPHRLLLDPRRANQSQGVLGIKGVAANGLLPRRAQGNIHAPIVGQDDDR